MVSFTLLALLLVGVTRLLLQSVLASRHQGLRFVARNLAENRLESICASAFSLYQVDQTYALASQSVDGNPFQLELQLATVTPYDAKRLRRVTVKVVWTEKSRNCSETSVREVSSLSR